MLDESGLEELMFSFLDLVLDEELLEVILKDALVVVPLEAVVRVADIACDHVEEEHLVLCGIIVHSMGLPCALEARELVEAHDVEHVAEERFGVIVTSPER